MPLSSLTLEKVQALQSEAEEWKAAVERLRGTTEKDMWRADLDAFEGVGGGGKETAGPTRACARWLDCLVQSAGLEGSCTCWGAAVQLQSQGVRSNRAHPARREAPMLINCAHPACSAPAGLGPV
jgi:hypothetical protein